MNSWPNGKKKDSFELLRKFPIQNSPNLPNLVVFYPIYRQLKIIKKIVFFSIGDNLNSLDFWGLVFSL